MSQEIFKIPLIPYKYKIFFQVIAVVSFLIADMPLLNIISIPLDESIKDMVKIVFLVVSLLLLITKYKTDDEMIYLIRFKSLVYALMSVILISVMLIILVPNATNHHRYDSLVLTFMMYFMLQFIALRGIENEK